MKRHYAIIGFAIALIGLALLWAGADITAAPKKRFVRKIDGVVQKDKRLDKGLKNVIVNETLNKHNLK